MELTRLEDGKKISIDPQNITPLRDCHGDQVIGMDGKIYFLKYENNNYVLKVMPFEKDITSSFKFLKEMRKRLKLYKNEQGFQYLQAIPYAQGAADGNLFKIGTTSCYLLMMPYIKQDKSLFEYTKQYEMGELPIKKIAKKIVLAANILAKTNIIHGDFFPDNILLSENNGEYSIKIIDFQGGGIFDANKKRYIYTPRVKGKDYYFGYPYELYDEKAKPTPYTESWIVLALIFKVLSGKRALHPFFFLKKYDYSTFNKVLSNIYSEQKHWPPRFKSTIAELQNVDRLNKSYEYLLDKTSEEFMSLCFDVFLANKPEKRPSIQKINQVIQKL